METPRYDKSKQVILAELCAIFPGIKPYTNNVTWDRSDDGWHPHFDDAPEDVLLALGKALRDHNAGNRQAE